jgi:hypothetical protein
VEDAVYIENGKFRISIQITCRKRAGAHPADRAGVAQHVFLPALPTIVSLAKSGRM